MSAEAVGLRYAAAVLHANCAVSPPLDGHEESIIGTPIVIPEPTDLVTAIEEFLRPVLPKEAGKLSLTTRTMMYVERMEAQFPVRRSMLILQGMLRDDSVFVADSVCYISEHLPETIILLDMHTCLGILGVINEEGEICLLHEVPPYEMQEMQGSSRMPGFLGPKPAQPALAFASQRGGIWLPSTLAVDVRINALAAYVNAAAQSSFTLRNPNGFPFPIKLLVDEGPQIEDQSPA